ncbi:MAG: gamma-glutamyl-phosphate reductase, partial [Clostridia bacterium]|nr:gamma-glutamyl-phosphate reductase [Clostridia bacterium]
MTEQLQTLLCAAKTASRKLATLSADKKNQVLLAIATALTDNSDKILAANAVDVKNAKGHISESMIDRLSLTKARIEGMAKGVREVVELPDPVGKILDEFTRPNGIKIKKVSVPLGVIAIIYESRPNVTADAAALCLKSGNVCILRG